jgi:two-component system, cell cycle sensor histidine kinase and response regulator CckA
VIEEQEAATEELKSANEEIQSANEELQSTNEELLTAKEELQSANEELITVNEEMQGRNTELNQLNNDLTNVLSSVNIPIVMLSADLRLRRFTPQAEKMLSLLPSDAGRPIRDFRLKINVPHLEELCQEVIDHLAPKEREVQDQEGRTYSMWIRPYRTADHRIEGVVLSLYDITERRLASEARYRRLSAATRDGMVVADRATGEILEATPVVTEIFGYTRAQLVGSKIWESPLFQSAGLNRETIDQLQEDESLQKALFLPSATGNLVESEIAVRVYPEGNSKVVQISVRDVGARRRMEEALRRTDEQVREAQKMEAVGRLAGGVAHDFNNLLTAILGYGDLAKQQIGEEHPAYRHLEQVVRAGERASLVTRQLLAFSRRQVLKPTVLDINQVLAEAQQLLTVTLGNRIQLVTLPGAGLGKIKADRGQIEQTIVNLAINARDAMPEGGRITIETSNVEVDEAFAQRHPTVAPGSYVCLSVKDTGTGMDAETQAHMFEPFYTTKPKGQGTGLGLATIYGIVKQSGGAILTFSEVGSGTEFRIYLPRVEAQAAVEPAGGREGAVTGGTETILVVEDEPALRSLARRILESRGYTVLAAADGPEALQISRSRGEPIHLLLTDVVMPGMSGREVADRLAAERPDLKVVYMSGHTEDAIVHHGVLEEGMRFLQKPFSAGELAGKVREALDAVSHGDSFNNRR